MDLIVIENKPKYEHTIPECTTTFLGSVEGEDFYYRNNGFNHNIDIRYSEEPSDYTTWSFGAISSVYVQDYSNYIKVIPKVIYDKARRIIQ